MNKKARGGKGMKTVMQTTQRSSSGKGGDNCKSAARMVDPPRASEWKEDGSWTRDASGRQFCWAFNKGPCKRLPSDRAHTREKRRGTDLDAKDCTQPK